MPLSKSSQALACTAGSVAFCAASPYEGAKSAPRVTAYFFSASLFEMFSAQIRSIVFTTSSGTPLGMKMPNSLAGAEKPGKVADSGGIVPKPSSSSGRSPTVASGRRRLPRIMSACSTASWVVTSASPATVATTAGLPPS